MLSFPNTKQYVSIFDTMIWVADSLKSEFSNSLKSLYACPRDHGGPSIGVRRSPIHFRLGVSIPDCEYDDVSLIVIDNGFRRCADVECA